ncbi:MAG: MerR family transcriptional regulator, partial [Gammaproteobacteria bacterium]|nr:MerR family transcriptional regulator [Gammaproteobacteria bacterium]
QYSLDELSTLANVPRRTVRYYIQRGLLDRPIGETRAAYYTEAHLQQLLQIRKWTEAGLSLEAIRELLADDGQADRLPAPRAGSVTVKSHLVVSPGLELVVEPTQAGLKPEEVRRLFKAVLAAYDEIAGTDPAMKKNTQKEHGK